jgi:hypothetical protein
MHFPCIGSLVYIGSNLLESLLKYRLVEELGDESHYASFLIETPMMQSLMLNQ